MSKMNVIKVVRTILREEETTVEEAIRMCGGFLQWLRLEKALVDKGLIEFDPLELDDNPKVIVTRRGRQLAWLI